MVTEPFCASLSSLVAEERTQLRRCFSAQGVLLADQRNELVKAFLKDGVAEWLLFLDTDIIFRPDLIQRLLHTAHARERPIVSGLYLLRIAGKVQPAWYGEVRVPISDIPSMKPLQLEACGMGCCLIHKGVLESLRDTGPNEEWRWFAYDLDPLVKGKRMGEDITFCLRARRQGFTIWGDPSIRLGHVKSTVLALTEEQLVHGSST
jgi:hypothetical protein